MPTHPLKAWPYGEWWMPAGSTGTSTSLLLVVPINDHMVSGTPGTSRKERRMDICKKADFMTPATMAQDGTLVRTLTSYVWVDWALLPLSTRNLRLHGIQ